MLSQEQRDALVDQFVNTLTPQSHRSAAVPFSNVTVSYAQLRDSAYALLSGYDEALKASPPPEPVPSQS